MIGMTLPGLRATSLRKAAQLSALLVLATLGHDALAQPNAIESVTATPQGDNVVVKVTMKTAPSVVPTGFVIANPSRIALDFGDTLNATGKNSVELNTGDVRGANVVQAGSRSRLVLNLARSHKYSAAIDGKTVVITIKGNSDVADSSPSGMQVVTASKAAAASSAPVAGERQQLRNIDFRRGTSGEGKVVIDLPNNQVSVDVHQQGNSVIVDFLNTGVPEKLRKRLDVSDFGTPVSQVTTTAQGSNARMTIAAKGLWEQSVYQSETQLVVDIKPVKEDVNKLSQGTQGYRGEKMSFDFQNVEIRAVLQAIAEISGLNIITSDSVSGSLTLRLKDVPWDQALDVVLNAKGLDMRKNGTVVWIAPKEELLTKEKLELEQRAQIAELEPLRSEVFQLNYQKAESFKTVFGIGDSGSSSSSNDKNRVLSKRGSAIIEPRTNQLFITDVASKLDDIRKLIQKVDIASRQVLIEARIVEATDTFSRNLGSKLSISSKSGVVAGDIDTVAATSSAGTSTAYTTSSLFSLPAAAINGTNAGSLAVSLFSSGANRFLNLELSALEADGKGKIISSPRVVTADQTEALIEQGTEIPYQESSSSGATTISFRKATLKLQVTPQITPDGNIVLTVDVNKDTVGEATAAGLAIDTKHVKTQVMVENGGTVVLGGIYQQTETLDTNQIPLLGDIPVLGYLFRNTAKTNDKTELLVFLTPKIVAEKAISH
jgi:type IV pilus assembly protein PilQ